LVFKEDAVFRRKLAKIAENCVHNIGPRSGQVRDEEISDWIRRRFTEFGLDTVKTETYNVLLSFPNVTAEPRHRSKVQRPVLKKKLCSGTCKLLVAPVSSLEASLSLVAQQGEIESTYWR
jgi:hypothetical protein